MSKLLNFYNELEKLRKPEFDDPYDNRITHCYLLHEVDGKIHEFIVRGWTPIKDGVLDVSVVNWTIAAGSASLGLTEDRVDKWKIKEA